MRKIAPVVESGTTQADTYSQPPYSSQGRAGRSDSRKTGERTYSELAARLFNGPEHRSVVAFAAVSRGEGVTRTVCGLAADLARAGKSVVALDGELRPLGTPNGRSAEFDDEPLSQFAGNSLQPDQSAKIRKLASLRERYDATLLDCGSLQSSMNLLYLAPAADGVVLVVEAGRPSKQQIDRATDLIADAGGTFLGFVLNKRRYPIPDWLYRLLP